MPKKEDVEFQIELLKIQISSEIYTEFFVALIAIGVASLLSLGISLGIAGSYDVRVALAQAVVGTIYVVFVFFYWVRQVKRIDSQIADVRKKFGKQKETAK